MRLSYHTLILFPGFLGCGKEGAGELKEARKTEGEGRDVLGCACIIYSPGSFSMRRKYSFYRIFKGQRKKY